MSADAPASQKFQNAAAQAPQEGMSVRIELGRQWVAGEDASRLDVGSVVELREPSDAPVELRCGARPIGKGELVVVDGRLAVRVTRLSDVRSGARVER